MAGQTSARPRFIQSKFGGLPRSYWVLWVGTLINRLGTMVQPFFAFYLTGTRGLPLSAVGLVLTMFGAGALSSQLLAGWLADRFGRRVTLTGGMLVTGSTMLMLAYSESVLAIAVSMFLLGLAMDIYRPASSALIADVVPPVNRAKAFGLLFWAVNLGFTGGVLTGGTLAESHIMLVFWIDAISCVLFGLMVWFGIRETRQPSVDKAGTGNFLDVLNDRLMVAFTLVTMAYGFTYLQSLQTLPLAMKAAGLPASAFGIVAATNGVIIVALQPLLVNWLGERDHSRVVAVGMVLVGLGFGLTAFASTTLGYLATVVVWSIGEIAFTGVSAAIAADLAPPHLRGRYMGLYGFAWSFSNLIAPLFGIRLFDHGPATLWIFCAGMCFLAAIGQLMLGPAIRRRTAALALEAV